MTLIILLSANIVLSLVDLVLTIINIHNTEKATYDLVNDMANTRLDELSEELQDYFKGE